MFRFLLAGLAIIGAIALLSTGLGIAAALGFLILGPLFLLLKIAFFVFLISAVMRMFGRRSNRHRGSDWHRSSASVDLDETWKEMRGRWDTGRDRHRRRRTARTKSPAAAPSDTDRFEEWHRMAHAHKEVESWVDPEIDE